MNHADVPIIGSYSGRERIYGTLRHVRAVIWRGLTLLTCPCCIPIWIAVLSGTAAGALLSENIFLTVAAFLPLFLYCFWKAVRSYDSE